LEKQVHALSIHRSLYAWLTYSLKTSTTMRTGNICGAQPLLLNWFRAKKQFSSGIVEGFNTKAKLTTRKAYGFKTYHAAEIALHHALGALPVPKNTHVFF
jgi:hypothetical protein